MMTHSTSRLVLLALSLFAVAPVAQAQEELEAENKVLKRRLRETAHELENYKRINGQLMMTTRALKAKLGVLRAAGVGEKKGETSTPKKAPPLLLFRASDEFARELLRRNESSRVRAKTRKEKPERVAEVIANCRRAQLGAVRLEFRRLRYAFWSKLSGKHEPWADLRKRLATVRSDLQVVAKTEDLTRAALLLDGAIEELVRLQAALWKRT